MDDTDYVALILEVLDASEAVGLHLRVFLQLPPVVHGDSPDHAVLGKVVHQGLVGYLGEADCRQLFLCLCFELAIIFAAKEGQFRPFPFEIG